MVLLSFVFSLGAVIELQSIPNHSYEVIQFTWLPGLPSLTSGGAVPEFTADWGFLLDPISSVMILVVTGIGFLIHVYSIGYMAHDGGYYRFFGQLNLFVFFMLMLVLANNYVLLFVGWEGVGLCSYLLIGFYFHKKSAGDAANKAFLVNRIGDAAFILGMLLMFSTLGTLKFTAVAPALAAGGFEAETAAFGVISAITLLLFIGATGKSAQIPLYVWLPDAMEGPTPVSALIHAATMVTAGVYMVARSSALYVLAPKTMLIVAVIGAITAIFAATIGLVQHDIKRVLAYSTVSQLGYMFLAMGVGAFGAGIFHLYTHAFFKALLFLGSGAVIHALHGEQDIRNMGGLRKALPITYWTFLIGAIAIAGVPGLSGFFSKDEILFETFVGGHTVLWAMSALTALLTAAYMFRLVFLTFHGERRHDAPAAPGQDEHPHTAPAHVHPAGSHLHDAPPAMAVALVVLAIGSVAAGWVGIPHALGGHNALHTWLEPVFVADVAGGEAAVLEGGLTEGAGGEAESHESLERTLMLVSSVLALLGIGMAWQIWITRRDIAEAAARRCAPLHRLLLNKYYVDEIYDATIVQPIRIASQEGLWRGVDVRVIDAAVNGVGAVVDSSAAVLRRVQTGSVRAYAGSLFAGVVMILGYYLWR
jgi:NADH-quinone oxidoreductase subunit L